MNITDFDASTNEYSFTTVVFDQGNHPEDGSSLEGLAYVITATTVEGYVFHRYVGSVGWEIGTGEDGFPDVYRVGDHTALDTVCNRMMDHLNGTACPRLNNDVWDFYGASYGSVAYQKMEANGTLSRDYN